MMFYFVCGCFVDLCLCLFVGWGFRVAVRMSISLAFLSQVSVRTVRCMDGFAYFVCIMHLLVCDIFVLECRFVSAGL